MAVEIEDEDGDEALRVALLATLLRCSDARLCEDELLALADDEMKEEEEGGGEFVLVLL